jgi:hypothetical protein
LSEHPAEVGSNYHRRRAVEVVAVFDRGQVSSSQWVTEYTLRDVGSTETRRVTSLQDIEDLCRFMFPFTFEHARIMRDTISVQGACSYRAFTRDRSVTKYLHIPYVEPGAPLPPERGLYSRYWDEEDPRRSCPLCGEKEPCERMVYVSDQGNAEFDGGANRRSTR